MEKTNKEINFDSVSDKDIKKSGSTSAKKEKNKIKQTKSIKNQTKEKKEQKNVKKTQNSTKKINNNHKKKKKDNVSNKLNKQKKENNSTEKSNKSTSTKSNNVAKNDKDTKNNDNNENKKNLKESKHIKTKKNQKNKNKSKKVVSKHEKKKTKAEIRAENKQKKDKKNKIIKIALCVAGSVLGVYLLGVLVFSFLCFPRTSAANVDLSFRDPDFMKDDIKKNAQNYYLIIEGYKLNFKVEGEQINYAFDAEQVVQNIKDLKNPFLWPCEIFKVHNFMDDSIIDFDKELASSIVLSAVQQHNSIAVAPVNASILCDPVNKSATIKQEIIGNTLKSEAVILDAIGYIGSGRNYLYLNNEHLEMPTLYSNDERCDSAIESAQLAMKSTITLMMDNVQAASLSANIFAPWIELKENYLVGFNYSLLSAWVSGIATQFDTVGKPRTYTTPYGKQVTVSGGDALGWKIDQGSACNLIEEACMSGSVKTIVMPCSSTLGAYVGIGQRDWGPNYVDVDLSTQQAYYYDANGNLAWNANIVSGKPSSPTPTGLYTIKSVTGPTTLLGQMMPNGKREYESVVQHWMPFVGNMIGFHDAYWQTKFGGDWYVEHGSHGCINLSNGDAASLRSMLSVGVIVVIHY